MNYERGLGLLREFIRKSGDEYHIRYMAKLEKHFKTLLQGQELDIEDPRLMQRLQFALDDLERLACRTMGISFLQLCGNPKQSAMSISLKALLFLILGALFVSGGTIVLASSIAEVSLQRDIEQNRKIISDIDRRIGQNVSSFFYLENTSACAGNVLQSVVVTGEVEIRRQFDQFPESCTWEYRDEVSGMLLAVDFWEAKSGLFLKRAYYLDTEDNMIAKDLFDWQSNECFRRRIFADSRINDECYSESGELRTIVSRDQTLAPVPPLVYWFFYR